MPTITFFQVRKQNGQTIFADAVASVRMGGLDELRNFQKSIEEAIENHLSREK